jgi:hypothetical protein
MYIYINSTNIPPIMIINRIYEHQNILCFLPGQAKDLSATPVVICKEFNSRQCHNFIQFFSELNCPLLKLLMIIGRDFYVQPLMIS